SFFSLPRATREEISFYATPASFGRASGIFEYVHTDSWQEIGNSNLVFSLSKYGPQKVYARFRDDGTNQTESVSANVRFLVDGDDANLNGIADVWERHYFADGDVQGDSDSDGDGFSNRDEYLAGTDPLDPGSALRLSVHAENGTILRLAGIP